MTIAWSVEVPGTADRAPAFDDIHAYVPLSNGELTALRLDDGRTSWWVAVAATQSLAVGGGLVFVPEEGAVMALESGTGFVRWRAPVGGRISAPALWETGWLIVGLEAGDLLALRAETGETIWRQQPGGTLRVPPTIAGDRLYLALDDKRIVAVDLTSGKTLWEQRLPDTASQILAFGDRLYAGARDNFLYCLLAATGRIDWNMRVGADVLGPAVADDERVYFVAMDNVLRALDRRTGNQRWRQSLTIRPAGPPIRARDLLIVSGRLLDVRGFNRRDGGRAGAFGSPMEVVGLPYYRSGEVIERDRIVALTYTEEFALRLVALAPWREPQPSALDAVPGVPMPPDPAPQIPYDILPGTLLAPDPPPFVPYEALPGILLPTEPPPGPPPFYVLRFSFFWPSSSRIAEARRCTPSVMRSGSAAENASRTVLHRPSSTKKAEPAT